MARKIVITSGKGGVGKTTVCANLGVKLANLGFRVLLIDADVGLNNLDVVMGIEDKITYDIGNVVNEECRPKQSLVQDDNYSTLFILPSGNDNNQTITAEKMKEIVNHFDNNFDYILIDCPAGVDEGFHRAVFCADEALVVVTPHISSLRDADKVLNRLANYNLFSTNLIINRVRGDMLLSGEIISVEKITDILDTNVIGVIPDDDALGTLSAYGAFCGGSSGTRAFVLLAENVHNGSKKIYDCTFRYRGISGTIRRNLRRRV